MSSSDRLYRLAEVFLEAPPQQRQNCLAAVPSSHQQCTKGPWASKQLQHLAATTQPLYVNRIGKEMLLLQQQLQSCHRVGGMQQSQMHKGAVGIQYQPTVDKAAVLLQQQPQAATSALLCSSMGEDPAPCSFTSSSSSSSHSADAGCGAAATADLGCMEGVTDTAKRLASHPTPLCTACYKQPGEPASSHTSSSRTFSVSSSQSFSSGRRVSNIIIEQKQPACSSSSSHGAHYVPGSRQTTVATPRMYTRMQSACTNHSTIEDAEGARPLAPAVCLSVPTPANPTLATPVSGASAATFPAASAAAAHPLSAFADEPAPLPSDTAVQQSLLQQLSERCGYKNLPAPAETAAASGAAASSLADARPSPATLAAANTDLPAAADTVGTGATAAGPAAAAKDVSLQSAPQAALLTQQHRQQSHVHSAAPTRDEKDSVHPLLCPQQQRMRLHQSRTLLQLGQESFQRRTVALQQHEQHTKQGPELARRVSLLQQQSQAFSWLQQMHMRKQLQQHPRAAAALLKKQQHQKQHKIAGSWQPQNYQHSPRSTTSPLVQQAQSQRAISVAFVAQQQQRRLRQSQLEQAQRDAENSPVRMQQDEGVTVWQEQQSGSDRRRLQQPEDAGPQQQQHYQETRRLQLVYQRRGPWQRQQLEGKEGRSTAGRWDLPLPKRVGTGSIQVPSAPLESATTAEAAGAGAAAKPESQTAEVVTCLFPPSMPLGAAAATARIRTEATLLPHLVSPCKLVVPHGTADLAGSLGSSSVSSSINERLYLTAAEKNSPALYPAAANFAVGYAKGAAVKPTPVSSSPPPAQPGLCEATGATWPAAAAAEGKTAAGALTTRPATFVRNVAASLCSTAPTVTSSATLLRCTSLGKAAGSPSTYCQLPLSLITADIVAGGATGTGALAGTVANAPGLCEGREMQTAEELGNAGDRASTLTAAGTQDCRGPQAMVENCQSIAVLVTSRGEAGDSPAVGKHFGNTSASSACAPAAEQTQTPATPQSTAGAEQSEAGTRTAAVMKFASKREAKEALQERCTPMLAAATQGAARPKEDLLEAVTSANPEELPGGWAGSWVAGPVAARAATCPFFEREGYRAAPTVTEIKMEPERSSACKPQASRHSSVTVLSNITPFSAESAPAAEATTGVATALGAAVGAVVAGAGAPAAVSGKRESASQEKVAEDKVPLTSGSCFLASSQSLQQLQQQLMHSKEQQQKQLVHSREQQHLQLKGKELLNTQQEHTLPEQRKRFKTLQRPQPASSDISLPGSLLAENIKRGGLGHYVFGDTLGEGTFGKVKLGVHAATQEAVAVKVLDKQKIQEANDVERVMREIHILKTLRHPHIVQLLEIIETQHHLYLVMEYASGGELYDYIVERQHVDERQACSFFRQILAGVEEMHKLQICHRDLKPENILLDESRNIKIVDFGLSNTYSHSGSLLTTACGSPSYAAPEMIEGKAYQPLMVDLWSCGVILFTLLAGYLPFESATTEGLYKKIIKGTFECPPWISPAARHLLQGLLNTNPALRYDTQKIKQHPWYNMPHVRVGLPLLPLPYAELAAAAAVVAAAAHAAHAQATPAPADPSCISSRRRSSTSSQNSNDSSSRRNSCQRGDHLPFSTCGLPACGSCVQWARCSPQRPLECVLRQMAEMGVDAEATKTHLAAGEINSLTATYFLMVNRRHRRADSKPRVDSMQPRQPPALLLPPSPFPYYCSAGAPPPGPCSAAAAADFATASADGAAPAAPATAMAFNSPAEAPLALSAPAAVFRLPHFHPVADAYSVALAAAAAASKPAAAAKPSGAAEELAATAVTPTETKTAAAGRAAGGTATAGAEAAPAGPEAPAAAAETAAPVTTPERVTAQIATTAGGEEAHATTGGTTAEPLATEFVAALPSNTRVPNAADFAEAVTVYLGSYLANPAIAAGAAAAAGGATIQENTHQAASEPVECRRLRQRLPAAAGKDVTRVSSSSGNGSSRSSSSSSSSSSCFTGDGRRSSRRKKAPGKEMKQQTKCGDNLNSTRSKSSRCPSNDGASAAASVAAAKADVCSPSQTAGAAASGKTRGPPRSAHATMAAARAFGTGAASSSYSSSRAARGSGEGASIAAAAAVLAPTPGGGTAAAARRSSNSATAAGGGEDPVTGPAAVATKRNGNNQRKRAPTEKAIQLPLHQLHQRPQQTTAAGFYTHRQPSAAVEGRRRASHNCGGRCLPLSARFCSNYEGRSRVAASAAEAAAAAAPSAPASGAEAATAAEAAAGGGAAVRVRTLRLVSPAARAAASATRAAAAAEVQFKTAYLPGRQGLHNGQASKPATIKVEDGTAERRNLHPSTTAAGALSARQPQILAVETAAKKTTVAVATHAAAAAQSAETAHRTTKAVAELVAGATTAAATRAAAAGAPTGEATVTGVAAAQMEPVCAGATASVTGATTAVMPSSTAGSAAGEKREPPAVEPGMRAAEGATAAEKAVGPEENADKGLLPLRLPLLSAELGSNWRSATASPHRAARRATVATAARAIAAAAAARDTATTVAEAATATAAVPTAGGRRRATTARSGAAGRTVWEQRGGEGGGTAAARKLGAGRTATAGAATRVRAAAERARAGATSAAKENNQGVLQRRPAPATARGEGLLYRKEHAFLMQQKGSRTARSRLPGDDLYARFRCKASSSSNSGSSSSNSSNNSSSSSGGNSGSTCSNATTCKRSTRSGTTACSDRRSVEFNEVADVGRVPGSSSLHSSYSPSCGTAALEATTVPEPATLAEPAAAAGSMAAASTKANTSPSHAFRAIQEEGGTAFSVQRNPAAAHQAATPVQMIHQLSEAAAAEGLNVVAATADGIRNQQFVNIHSRPVNTYPPKHVSLPPALRSCYTERQLLSPVHNVGWSAAAYLFDAAPAIAAKCVQRAEPDYSWTDLAATTGPPGFTAATSPFPAVATATPATAAPAVAACAVPGTASPPQNRPSMSFPCSTAPPVATGPFFPGEALPPHLTASAFPGCAASLHSASADVSYFVQPTDPFAHNRDFEGPLQRAPPYSLSPVLVEGKEKGKGHSPSPPVYSFNSAPAAAAAECLLSATPYPFVREDAGYSAKPVSYSLTTAVASAACRAGLRVPPSPTSAVTVAAVRPVAGPAAAVPTFCPATLCVDSSTCIPPAATAAPCGDPVQAGLTGAAAVAAALAGDTAPAVVAGDAAESATAGEMSENTATTATAAAAQVPACAGSCYKSAFEAGDAGCSAAAAASPARLLSASTTRPSPRTTVNGVLKDGTNSDSNSTNDNKSYITFKSYSASSSSPSCRSSNSSCNKSGSSGVYVSESSNSNSTRSRSSSDCHRSSSVSSRSSSSNRGSTGRNGKKVPSLAVTAMRIDAGIKMRRRPLTARDALPLAQRYTHTLDAAAVAKRRGSAAAAAGAVGSYFDAATGVCLVQNVYQQVPQGSRHPQQQHTQGLQEQQHVLQQDERLLHSGQEGQQQDVQQQREGAALERQQRSDLLQQYQQQREDAVSRQQQQQSELLQQYEHRVSLRARPPQAEQEQQSEHRCTLQQQQLRQQRLWRQQHLAILQQHRQHQRLPQQQSHSYSSSSSKGFKARDPYGYGAMRHNPVAFRF